MLPAVPSESFPVEANETDARAFIAAHGGNVAAAPEAAAYARNVQIRERASGMNRDEQQAAVVAENCAKLAEAVSLIDANNAGP